MKVILGYHYPTGKWSVIDVMMASLSRSARDYKRFQVDDREFTEIIETEFDVLTIRGDDDIKAQMPRDFKFPYVQTLEESIADCKQRCQQWLDRARIK